MFSNLGDLEAKYLTQDDLYFNFLKHKGISQNEGI